MWKIFLAIFFLKKNSIPQTPDIANNILLETKKNNCLGKHIRNNLLGGAAGTLGFLFAGPVGALAAYSTVTASLETVTNLSNCQF